MIPMTIPRRNPIRNSHLRNRSSYSISNVEVVFIETWEEFVKDFIQDHDNWVHHVVHAREVIGDELGAFNRSSNVGFIKSEVDDLYPTRQMQELPRRVINLG